jgi:hypothetical protein
MKTKRLTDKHPLHKKVKKLFDMMSKLGVHVEIDRYGRAHVSAVGEEAELVDLEGSLGDPFGSFPPVFEWKLLREGT